MKVLVVIGTRPEAIKMFPIIHELSKANVAFKVCVTGQHRELLDQVLNFFDIVPDWDLDIMTEHQELNQLASRIILEVNEVLKLFQPNVVMVQGDTTTASMVALASFYFGAKVVHVEAGLRTNDISNPFPEELNRQIIARMSYFHFAPTESARENLLNEGIQSCDIEVTGNTTIDSLFFTQRKLRSGYKNYRINQLNDLFKKENKTILFTIHRRENFGSTLKELEKIITSLIDLHCCEIIWPVHPNPNIKNNISSEMKNNVRVHLLDPLNYPEMIFAMMNSDLIVSDSGGVQEEAPSLGKSIIVIRESTERKETITSGQAVIVSPKRIFEIIDYVNRIFNEKTNLQSTDNPYGDGKAAKRIVNKILNSFSLNNT